MLKETNLNFKYVNPFGEQKPDKVKYYTAHHAVVHLLDNRNFIVQRVQQYDYVVNGVCIAQRVGYSEELLDLLIKHKVAYDDYTKKYEVDRLLKGDKCPKS